MKIRERHNVHIVGRGKKDMLLAHGFGCDQNMWRFIVPAVENDFRVILYDLLGSGKSDTRAYDTGEYATLDGHARDVIAILEEVATGPAVFVGHSVSAMIGLLAGIAKPSLFDAQVMVAPSPCYINDGDYVGGFSRADIESLLDTLDRNYLGWASAIAPTIMGAPDRPELTEELANSFCRTDPEIQKHFARVTFLADNRADLPKLEVRALILQCSDDAIAPCSVGDYMHRRLPNSTLRVIENVGHCPHMSAPHAVISAMREFVTA